MPMFSDEPQDRYVQARPRPSFLDRHPGARVAALVLAIAVVLGLFTVGAWWPTQTEPCFRAHEPEVGACRDVAPAAIATVVLAVPSGGALVWMAVRDRRR